METPSNLLNSLLEESQKLSYDDGNLNKVMLKAELLAKKIFGQDSDYIVKLNNIKFYPLFRYSGTSRDRSEAAFQNGKTKLIDLINLMLEDLILSNIGEQHNNTNEKIISNNIFIVHGHNEGMKQSTARFLEKFDLTPVILHEKPNEGKTIIEKFTYHSDVNFAIVLLSADDIAYNKNSTEENAKFRARQNVIFELGFFVGKIGREKVAVICEENMNLEIHSDYQGVLYIPYDNNGSWKFSLAKELKANGYKIDLNNLI